MATGKYWADRYVECRRRGPDAIRLIRPGQRIFIGSACGEPQYLVREFSEAASHFTDVEIVRLLSLESIPLSLVANKTDDQIINLRSFYLGSASVKGIVEQLRFITPMNLSAVPRLFRERHLPLDVAMIQVSPPDDFGWMSLGISVDISLAAAQYADLVIAQVNPAMPRVLGRSFIHVNDVDVFVEHAEPLLTVRPSPEIPAANQIGRMIARLIADGSTLAISPGTTHQATLLALSDKNDLGVHTQYLTVDLMHLAAKGVITNRAKGFNDGKMVASTAIGDETLYEFVNDNPSIEFHPSDYVNDPGIIGRHRRMVTLNVAMAMDLTGQVAADALPYNHFCGVTGMLDFSRGAAMSEGGKSIILLPSVTERHKHSRIIPHIQNTAVVVPRGDVHYVATEYGVVNLFGKSMQERALALISIAHPDYRDELFSQAKDMGLFPSKRTLSESIRGVYPVKLEETRKILGKEITIRPAKPIDERRIQEHFYHLDKSDVIARFFHEKTTFLRREVQGISQIDYIKNLSLLALVGEFGFGQVIGIGEYLLEEHSNLAEVAFSVSKAFKGHGLGRILLRKLAEAARENGIAGLVAYTSPENQAMIRLFKTLPFQVKSRYEDDLLILTCRFDQPKTDTRPS